MTGLHCVCAKHAKRVVLLGLLLKKELLAQAAHALEALFAKIIHFVVKAGSVRCPAFQPFNRSTVQPFNRSASQPETAPAGG
ncbi:MAG: hypothetical protein KA752_00505 [Giesbergeria sp.]|nr:hypothetical protein [Giesbergeria sp.]